MKKQIVYILLAMLVFMASCVAKEVTLPESYDLSPDHFRLLTKLRNTMPERGTFTGHVVLNLNELEFDFVSYTAFDGDNFRALGMAEIGSRFFDFLFNDNTTEVLACPGQIPHQVVKNGPVRDISLILHTLHTVGTAQACGINCLITKSLRGSVIYTFDENGSIADSKEISGGALTRGVTYQGWKKFEGWAGNIPAEITVTNYEYHYKFSLIITDIKEGLKNSKIILSKTPDL
ncbi:MAG: hypothetical protein H7844_11335 [Nitrospirae bacterium YQR-1]